MGYVDRGKNQYRAAIHEGCAPIRDQDRQEMVERISSLESEHGE